VRVRGTRAQKASTLVAADDPVALSGSPRRFVSRGGEKLDTALTRFGIDVTGRECLDVGASTGGFTDCLVQRGAAAVVAVDVGYGQLAWRLRQDPRVTVLERTNARDLRPNHLPFRPSMVVADVSFISLRVVVPRLAELARDGADAVLLVKPQFEVGRDAVGKGGVVRDPQAWRGAVQEVARACDAAGLGPRAVAASPVLGPAGNAEFFLHAVRGGAGRAVDVGAEIAVAEAMTR
jgi:23S rRNA (cytidine1920-2'-O)/16S rRNA (cytidine1409-2'-O)-methyltransferase